MNTPVAHHRILVIDDTPSIHEDFRKILVPASTVTEDSIRLSHLADAIFGQANPAPAPVKFTLDCALQGEEGLARVIDALAQNQPYALAFVDMRIPPGWDGLETIRHLWATDPALQVVICTAYSDHTWSAISESVGHTDNLLILKKPFDPVEVLQLTHALTRKWQLARDNIEHLRQLDNLVTERTHQLDEAEARFTEAFNASPLAQAILDLDDNRFLDLNTAFENQFNLPLASLASLTPGVIPPDFDLDAWTGLLALLQSGQPADEHPLTARNARGKERHLRCSARTIALTTTAHTCAILVLRDITEQLETEQQLRQSQKLEAIGQLTAGIAHDFNNLLTVIHSYTSELLIDHSDPKTRAMLEPVQTAAMRAASLIRQLLIFSRKENIQLQNLDLNTLFTGLHALLRRLIDAHITLEWAIPPQLPRIIADPGSLEQIIVNLIVNARDAMPNGGRVRIEATPCEILASKLPHPEAKPGHYIAISIADTGTGIPPEVLPRIFEPFFTTKSAGKGTGLGLSTVYSIVKQHGGWIQVRSQPNTGTTFTFYHPVASSGSQTKIDSPLPTTSSTPHLPHHVLLVEDDPAIQKMLSSVLTRRNIKHRIASDGVAALSLWVNSPTPFDLLITDIIMPNGVSGLRLARNLREQNPGLHIILMSGHADAQTDPKYLDMPGPRPKFLNKPFSPEQLFAAIAETTAPLQD